MAIQDSRKTKIRRLLDDFQSRRQAGEDVSVRSVISAHPDLAPDLEQELTKCEFEGKSGALPAAGPPGSTLESQSHIQATRPLVRCPHCRHAFTIDAATATDDINCASCGKRISLLRRSIANLPRQIDRFELLEPLGMGSFGAVFRARDTRLDREVAVKIPRRQQIEEAEVAEVMHEARVAAKLRHPNIVAVHEVGVQGEFIYIVSDLIRGLPLNRWVEERPSTIREQVEICRQLAVALGHAHEQGIVHRDLKPANILIDDHDRPHLTDFGLAKHDVSEVMMTEDGRVLGTPSYMSPEQAKGDAQNCDPRSDVYSLGVVLFELLTGDLPFRGNLNVLIRKIIRQEPPSPRQLNSHVSFDLATICLKCLQKDSRHRYQSAQQLADDLQNWLDGKPVMARPQGRIERSFRWCMGHPREAGFICALLLTMAFVTSASISIANERHRGLQKIRTPITQATTLLLRQRMSPVVSAAAADLTRNKTIFQPDQRSEMTSALRTRYENKALRADLKQRDIVVESWFVVNNQGKLIAIWPHSSRMINEDFSQRSYYLDAMKLGPRDEPFIGEAYPSVNVGRHKIPVSVPLRLDGPDGRPQGVLVATVSAPITVVMDALESLNSQLKFWGLIIASPMALFVLMLLLTIISDRATADTEGRESHAA